MTTTVKIDNGDWSVSPSTGRPVLLSGQEKAHQDLSDLLFLPAPFGAGIEALVGTVPDDAVALVVALEERVRSGFNALLTLQRTTQQDARTPQDRFAALTRVQAEPVRFASTSALSRTGYRVTVAARTIAGGQPTATAGIVQGGR